MNKIIDGKHIASADFGPGLLVCRKLFRTALNSCFNEINKIQVKASATVRQFSDEIESMDGQHFEIKDLLTKTITSHIWDSLTTKKCDLDDEIIKLIIDVREKLEHLVRIGVLERKVLTFRAKGLQCMSGS